MSAVTFHAAHATQVPDRKRKPDDSSEPRRQPRYQVWLWDDNQHTYAYVVRMMRELFGLKSADAFEIAQRVDTRGKAVCLVSTREHAELKRDQILAFGKDDQIVGCSGSMRASIAPCG